jgi:DNA-binding transcriptional LysR family regulator
MLEKLLSGDVDVVFYGSFGQRDFTKHPFKCRVFGKFPLTACVLRSNPLAQKDEIEISDLRTQDFIMLSPLIAPMWLGYVTDMCIQERFTPRVAAYVDDVSSLPMNLRTNHSVFITDKYCTVDASNFDIVYLPVKDTYIGSTIAWNSENENELILAMVEASRRYWADTAPDF